MASSDTKHQELQELKEKNAELLYQLATSEQQIQRMQRGFEIVYCLLPKMKVADTTLVETKKLFPDITFSPKEFM